MSSTPTSGVTEGRMIKKITLKNGQTSYEARWRDSQGEHRRRFRTKKDAEAALQLGRDRRQRRKAGLPEEQPPINYGELVERFLAQSTIASQDWQRDMLRYSLDRFAAVEVRDLLPDRIGSWNKSLSVAPKTKKHALDAMRQVLNAGVEWGYLFRNPARPQAVRGPRQVEPDIRPFCSWAEVEHVASCAGAYEPLVLFACATGLRPEEWIPLRWETSTSLRERSESSASASTARSPPRAARPTPPSGRSRCSSGHSMRSRCSPARSTAASRSSRLPRAA